MALIISADIKAGLKSLKVFIPFEMRRKIEN